jgi:hypothetical protein
MAQDLLYMGVRFIDKPVTHFYIFNPKGEGKWRPS